MSGISETSQPVPRRRRARLTLATSAAALSVATASLAFAASPRVQGDSPNTRAAAPGAQASLQAAADLGAGFERLDGGLYATVTPRLLLQSKLASLHLGLPLRHGVFGRGDGGGGLRRRDFDQRSELLRPLQRLRIGTAGGDVELLAASDLGLSLGAGALVDGLRPSLLPDHGRVGGRLRADAGPVAFEALTEDLTRAGLLALRAAVRPLASRGSPGRLSVAFEAVADRDAPIAAARPGAAATAVGGVAPRVAVLLTPSYELLPSPRTALQLAIAGGGSSHDGDLGFGLEASAQLRLQASDRRAEAFRLQLAWVHGSGAWLPAAFDAGYLLERGDLRGESLAARLRRVAAGPQGGVGSGLRAAFAWTLAAPTSDLGRSAQLHGELRLLPQIGLQAEDLSAAALQLVVRERDLFASAGWRRRPGGVHLAAAGAGLWLAPWLRAEVRLERALHAPVAGGAHRASWDGGLALVMAPGR